MKSATLLCRLLDAEKALARGDFLAVTPLLVEAEDLVLAVQQELISALRENESLRQRIDSLTASSHLLPPPAAAAIASITQPQPAAPAAQSEHPLAS